METLPSYLSFMRKENLFINIYGRAIYDVTTNCKNNLYKYKYTLRNYSFISNFKTKQLKLF